MRSGSNLLEQSLNQFAGLHCFGELFNPAFIGGPSDRQEDFGFTMAARERDPAALIARMIERSADVLPGFRFFDGHDPRVLQYVLDDQACAKIILSRDYLDSYVSLEIARMTDQWLLREAPHRKTGRIRIDPQAFAQFRATKTAYFSEIRRKLQKNGQTAFEIAYPAQKEPEVLNGLARYMGLEEKLKSIRETICRQNPEPLSEKIENFAEMQASLGNLTDDLQAATSDPMMRANIPKMVTCVSQPLLFAPIPGGPNDEVLRWMNCLDGGEVLSSGLADSVSAAEILHTGHSRRTLVEWMQSNPGLVTMTAVRHPVVRAYDAFMTRIFSTLPGSFDQIRQHLINHYDLQLPGPEDIATQAYRINHHRAAFHTFLRFLRDNLAGQTSIRIDGHWASQMSFVTSFNTAVPIMLVAKEGQLDMAFRHIEALLDVTPPALGPPIQRKYEFSLDETYTRQTENLARKAYKADYSGFGFDDYQAALEA